MGIAADVATAANIPSVPKVAMLCGPQPARTLSGRSLAASDADICVRMLSVGQPHRAVPITGSICLAVAARIPGSVAHQAAGAVTEPLRIAHPSGVTLVDASVVGGASAGAMKAEYGAVYRSARRLFEGNVLYRAP
jgi:2-methylaconitate cis-trans-isomerase PrpF